MKNTHTGVLLLVELHAKASKILLFLKVTLFHGCFSRVLNCTNETRSSKASHTLQRWSKFKMKVENQCRGIFRTPSSIKDYFMKIINTVKSRSLFLQNTQF